MLNIERVLSGGFSNNLTLLILRSLEEYGGLIVEQIANKVVCFGSNGVLVFIGDHMGVAAQLKSKVTPFFIAVHDMAHCTNLAMQTLSALPWF
jgi:hypothetical protein